MKKLLFLLAAIPGLAADLFAQPNMSKSNLPEILIARDISVHFVSPEPIRYVDISSRAIAGDLPVKNILRVKLLSDSLKYMIADDSCAVVTVVGESFIAQYQLRLAAASRISGICTRIDICPSQMHPVDIAGVSMTTPELKKTALAILSAQHSRPVRKVQAYGIRATLNHVYTAGELIFLDLTFTNQTRLAFETDRLQFKIEDSRIIRSTNAQSITIKPLWQLYPDTGFKQNQHNIYVLQKLTFPDHKVLKIELEEKPISGRSLSLSIKYKDILNADTF